jgi:YbbR domain-containing protein
MRAALSATRQTLEVGWLLLQASMRNLRGHWALAIFSIVAAFTIWLVIQDVENPRVEGLVPPEPEQAIQVEFVNSGPDVTVVDAAFVKVRVEARTDRIGELRANDFQATVNLQNLEAGAEVRLPVTVRSTDGDVRVLEVEPPEVLVTLQAVAEKEMQVTIRQTSALPDGYTLAENPSINPRFVTVRGPQDLVDNVVRVEVDVNLAGQFADFEVTRDLVARNANGQRQLVNLSTAQATVQFDIEQVVQSREFAVTPVLPGTLAPGYMLVGIEIEPKFVAVTASDEVLDSITALLLEELSVEGASDDITRTVAIRPIQNAGLSPAEVTVSVDIEPVECGDGEGGSAPCGSNLFVVAPVFDDAPAGLQVAPGVYSVPVQVTGPPLALSTLSLGDIVVRVSLAGATAGTQTLAATVTAPIGVDARALSQISVTLVAQ